MCDDKYLLIIKIDFRSPTNILFYHSSLMVYMLMLATMCEKIFFFFIKTHLVQPIIYNIYIRSFHLYLYNIYYITNGTVSILGYYISFLYKKDYFKVNFMVIILSLYRKYMIFIGTN